MDRAARMLGGFWFFHPTVAFRYYFEFARHRRGPEIKIVQQLIRAFVLYLSTPNCFIHSFSW